LGYEDGVNSTPDSEYRVRLEIQVQEGKFGPGFEPTIIAAATATLQDQNTESGNLTVVLTDEAGICEYNLRFAGLNQPTDVLSFPGGEADPETGKEYLGDVIICPPIALTGASMGRHALLDEVSLLTVHGVLHLLGFDHDEEESRERMWAIQDRILDRLGKPIDGTTER
jgi:probable rRNA maturation factor